jgi:hypothetical protein
MAEAGVDEEGDAKVEEAAANRRAVVAAEAKMT